MPWLKPRRQLFFCAGLDLLGLCWGVLILQFLHGTHSKPSFVGLVTLATLYLLSGWLFGSYTVLRWPQFQLGLVSLRLIIGNFATLLFLILCGWLINAPESAVLFHRSTLVFFLVPMFAWSLLLRWLLNRMRKSTPKHPLVITDVEWNLFEKEYFRTPGLTPGFDVGDPVSFGSRLTTTRAQRTALSLAEGELGRLPPALLPESWLSYGDLPWASPLSSQRQLKRMADVLFSLLLLLLTAPLLLMAALLIWITDRGPVFYVQERSGWMGRPFQIYKLRTMRQASLAVKASWTQPGDPRITPVGRWLRRLRLDELPQLLNVLKGDMSLIGPRPERPEHEELLERTIPHYRKRHWMRPGLSGWAQVSAPYAASAEEAELKLSYDLFYLCHFSTGLDLLILFKTIKTVLKARGR